MRAEYLRVLKTTIHSKIICFKVSQNYSNAKMSEILSMDPRSYADLDKGKSMCGTLTFVLFLIYCCPDPLGFLEEIKVKLEEARDNAA